MSALMEAFNVQFGEAGTGGAEEAITAPSAEHMSMPPPPHGHHQLNGASSNNAAPSPPVSPGAPQVRPAQQQTRLPRDQYRRPGAQGAAAGPVPPVASLPVAARAAARARRRRQAIATAASGRTAAGSRRRTKHAPSPPASKHRPEGAAAAPAPTPAPAPSPAPAPAAAPSLKVAVESPTGEASSHHTPAPATPSSWSAMLSAATAQSVKQAQSSSPIADALVHAQSVKTVAADAGQALAVVGGLQASPTSSVDSTALWRERVKHAQEQETRHAEETALRRAREATQRRIAKRQAAEAAAAKSNSSHSSSPRAGTLVAAATTAAGGPASDVTNATAPPSAPSNANWSSNGASVSPLQRSDSAMQSLTAVLAKPIGRTKPKRPQPKAHPETFRPSPAPAAVAAAMAAQEAARATHAAALQEARQAAAKPGLGRFDDTPGTIQTGAISQSLQYSGPIRSSRLTNVSYRAGSKQRVGALPKHAAPPARGGGGGAASVRHGATPNTAAGAKALVEARESAMQAQWDNAQAVRRRYLQVIEVNLVHDGRGCTWQETHAQHPLAQTLEAQRERQNQLLQELSGGWDTYQV